MVQAGEEIHCLLPQTVIMKYGDKRMKSEGHLLCISQDKGQNWFFPGHEWSGHEQYQIHSAELQF
jgi:hypothetical protein